MISPLIHLFIAQYRSTGPVANNYICDIVWYVRRKMISREIIDIVSNIPRKYAHMRAIK